MELLRFLSAGSVDDGKSTLIGRILFETGALKKDQIETVAGLSESDSIDYSLFTDGLGFEREHKITLDVSYQYFSTSKRRYIIADCPGHTEYTRNMISGASTASVLVLMINAEKGIQPQTKKHLEIAAFLDIRHLIVCINKMDLVNYDQLVFERVRRNLLALKLTQHEVYFIPTSAIHGDFVLKVSDNMPWYKGLPLMEALENIPLSSIAKNDPPCYAVQIILNEQNHQYLLGRVISGEINVGQEFIAYPSEKRVTVERIYMGDKTVNKLSELDFGNVQLSGGLTSSENCILAAHDHAGKMRSFCSATLCWMDDRPFEKKDFIFKSSVQKAPCHVKLQTYESVEMNTLFTAELYFTNPLFLTPYKYSKVSGAFILIDPETHMTVASGTVTN